MGNQPLHLPEIPALGLPQLALFAGHSRLGSTRDVPSAEIPGLEGTARSKSKLTSVGVNDFDRLSTIGKGAYATVVLVRKRDDPTQKYLAMKIIRKSQLETTAAKFRTVAERDVLAYLTTFSHPFVVKLRYAFQTESSLYLVSDFAVGGDLFHHMSHSPKSSTSTSIFSLERCRLYAAELALALTFLHSRGILFRDLKPENILLDAEGHIMITDFGLSRLLLQPHETSAFTFTGTACYVAPEMIQSSSQQQQKKKKKREKKMNDGDSSSDSDDDVGDDLTATPKAVGGKRPLDRLVECSSGKGIRFRLGIRGLSVGIRSSSGGGEEEEEEGEQQQQQQKQQPEDDDDDSISDTETDDQLLMGLGGSDVAVPPPIQTTEEEEEETPPTGNGGYSFSIDWWAYGIIMYELLCGGHPFYHPDPQETYYRIARAKLSFPHPSSLSPDARDFIAGLLRKDPKRRLVGEAVLKHPFLASHLDMDAVLRREIVPEFVPGETAADLLPLRFVDDEMKAIDPNGVEDDEIHSNYSRFTYRGSGISEEAVLERETYWRLRQEDRSLRRRGLQAKSLHDHEELPTPTTDDEENLSSLRLMSTLEMLQGFRLSVKTRDQLGLLRDPTLTAEQRRKTARSLTETLALSHSEAKFVHRLLVKHGSQLRIVQTGSGSGSGFDGGGQTRVVMDVDATTLRQLQQEGELESESEEEGEEESEGESVLSDEQEKWFEEISATMRMPTERAKVREMRAVISQAKDVDEATLMAFRFLRRLKQ